MATWRKLITEALSEKAESWSDVVACTLNDAELDVNFDDSFGRPNGAEFTLWTKRRVYFPVVYDGAEWCESAPRHPSAEKTPHIGGG